MRSLSLSAWLLLTLIGCAHSPRYVTPVSVPVEDAAAAPIDSEVYAQLAHDRRHQSIAFLEEMLGMPVSSTAPCEGQAP